VDAKRLVEASYDRIADHYLASRERQSAGTAAALEELVRALPPGAAVLDLGCGAGVPVTGRLAERFAVTGVDISARQLVLARQRVPGATFIQADMTEVDFAPETFDAVVSAYAIIHVPREEQRPLVGRIHRWLRPGGLFLANWAVTAWEGEERDWLGWGAPMWWSHHDWDANLAMLRDAGFAVDATAAHADGDETWRWVLARKGTR
jgi:cyclopropane fatty-acyl-phospholipid synthase-like methyltransferase